MSHKSDLRTYILLLVVVSPFELIPSKSLECKTSHFVMKFVILSMEPTCFQIKPHFFQYTVLSKLHFCLGQRPFQLITFLKIVKRNKLY